MRIRMLMEKTGPRYDGRSWPPHGGEIDVPDEEGAGLCALGEAIPVPEERAETPEQPLKATEEKRAAPAAQAKPGARK